MTTKQVNYGPLQHLIGTWKGDKGMDVAPIKPDAQSLAKKSALEEENPFYEILTIEAAGDVTNAEEQTLVALRYHQSVFRKSNKEQFHDEVGYWLWNPANKTVMQSLTIPRAVALLAGGKVTESKDALTFKVSAGINNKDWGIIQSPFMQKKARTEHFVHTMTVSGKILTYSETTTLNIYGKRFLHTDGNTLTRL
jgi:hypothetical protein